MLRYLSLAAAEPFIHSLILQILAFIASVPLSLDISQKYSIAITTSNGHKYSSDFVEVKQTPAIDSLYWEYQPNDFNVYVNTHDPNNKTIYYRWDYIETWEHDSQLQTGWGEKMGSFFRWIQSTHKNTRLDHCQFKHNNTCIYRKPWSGFSKQTAY